MAAIGELIKDGLFNPRETVGIIGYGNVPGRVSKDASSLYAKNIFNFLNILIDKDKKNIDFDFNDEIISSVTLSYNGQIRLEQFK